MKETKMFEATKLFEDLGSTCFRNHRADSHCRMLHGHNLSFKFVFEAKTLDDLGWVIDFGGLKAIKERLEELFDHTVVLQDEDPAVQAFLDLDRSGVIALRVVPVCSCEGFAQIAVAVATAEIERIGVSGRVRVKQVECWESAKNSAVCVNTFVGAAA